MLNGSGHINWVGGLATRNGCVSIEFAKIPRECLRAIKSIGHFRPGVFSEKRASAVILRLRHITPIMVVLST